MPLSWVSLIISALLLPHGVVLQCTTTTPPDCRNCQNCEVQNNPPNLTPKVLSVRDDDDSSESKETKVRDSSIEADGSGPKYAIITGGNGNLALLNIAEQWPLVKHAVGSSGKFDGVILQHLNQPLKSLLESSNAGLKNYNNLFKLPNYLNQNPNINSVDNKLIKNNKDNLGNILFGRDSWGSPGGSRSYG